MAGVSHSFDSRRAFAAILGTLTLAIVPPALAALPPSAGPEPRANHLLGESSPYLQQHAHNPVDWFPWGEEALARARKEARPIFLSIGYSACHWCHVMEREAFSSEAVAKVLNEHFVSIKVDREERPDLDEIYMTAVQAMTGRGGWPMSVFLTPDLKPFYGATYVPTDRFLEVLNSITDAWKNRRREIEASAERVHALIEEQQRFPAPGESLDPGAPLLAAAVSRLKADFDPVHGGFGGAPKFPPHGALGLLLRAHRESGDDEALDLAVRTLDAMARGGLYDQVGGGFHRYSTDARWLVPHFEKMLYDNALLVPVYLEAWLQSGREDFRRIAEETLAWVGREMTDPGGGFYSTQDADSEGEEGRFYLWTAEEIRRAAGAQDAELLIAYYGMLEEGTLRAGRSILHVPVRLEEFARNRGADPAALRSRIDAARLRLLAVRDRRARPHLDDKVLTAWNGLMISALARAYAATGTESYRTAASTAARFVLMNSRTRDGRLLAAWRRGSARLPAYLDDSAFLARGLLDLHDVTGSRRWLDEAAGIVKDADRFLDRAGQGYFFTTGDRDDLIVRTKSLHDSALPSGNAIMVETLLRLSERLGDTTFREQAARTLALAGPALRRSPGSHAYMILAAGTLEVGGAAASGSPAVVQAKLKKGAGGDTEDRAIPAAPRALTSGRSGDRIVQGSIVGRANPQRVVGSTVTVPGSAVRPGQAMTLSWRLDIASGWHINSSTPTLEYLIPTRLVFPDPGLALVDEIAYPEGKIVKLKFADERLSVYEGATTIRATIRPSRDGAQGPREIRSRLTYQACSDTACLAPEVVEFRIPVTVEGEPVAAPEAPSGAGSRGSASEGLASSRRVATTSGGEDSLAALLAEGRLLALLGVVFLGGLALNLTPCVYPMVPVTIGYFAGQTEPGWGRRLTLPSLYVLGMAVTYSALGVAAGLSGGLIGSTLQHPWVVGGLVALFVAMALSMFGLFDVKMPGALTRFAGGRRGPVGALVMGLTMGLVAAPCIGPFVVGLLAFVGASGKPILGFWLFFVLALGMGLPNLVLGVFSGALSSLPRSGVWLIYAKKVMGIALLAVALYFAQPFLSDRHLGWIVLAFACVSGVYLAILDGTRLAGRWSLPVKAGIGLLVVLAGAWFSLPLIQARPELQWMPYSHEAFARAGVDGRPIIIDFFADWCLPCKELDRYTFTDPGVVEEAQRFLLLKADLTQFESEAVGQMRERFDVIGVPTIVFLDGRGEEHKDLRLYGFEEAELFLARMRQVR
jgi:uncharacterized protein